MRADGHMVKRFVIGLVVGVVGMALTWSAFDLYRYVHNTATPSAAAVSKPLEPLSVDPSWTNEGDPQFNAIETTVSPDGRTMVGLWECTGPATFTWQFGWDETVHLIEGKVEVEYLGERFTIEPGDTATFYANTEATWHVEDYALKSYTLHKPSLLGRAYREFFPPTP